MSHPENPRETGRLVAYRFLVGLLIVGRNRESVRMTKASIQQILRGDEPLRFNPTAGPHDGYTGERFGDSFFSLGKNLGGFGEGLKEGFEEILEMIETRYSDQS